MNTALRCLTALASGLAITMTAAGPADAGSAPALSWTPATSTATYDYGTIDVGTESVQTFTLKNRGRSGTSALKVTLTGSSAYTITGNTCSGTSLGPKKTCTVTVEYAPTTAGQTDTASLTVVSNKPAARATHTLTGSATDSVTNIQYTLDGQSLAFEEDSGNGLVFRLCDNEISWTGLQPSTGYNYVATFGDGNTWTFYQVSSSSGEGSVIMTEIVGRTWTIQAYDNSQPLPGQPVGEPSQTFTSQC